MRLISLLETPAFFNKDVVLVLQLPSVSPIGTILYLISVLSENSAAELITFY